MGDVSIRSWVCPGSHTALILDKPELYRTWTAGGWPQQADRGCRSLTPRSSGTVSPLFPAASGLFLTPTTLPGTLAYWPGDRARP